VGDGYIVVVDYGRSYFFFFFNCNHVRDHDMFLNHDLRKKLVVQDFIGDGLFCFTGGWFVLEGHDNGQTGS